MIIIGKIISSLQLFNLLNNYKLISFRASIINALIFYRDQADWFMKADDDTYVIVENLRYMLQPYNSSQPIYFGCKFKPYVKQGYMSGGAGKQDIRNLDMNIHDD